MHVRISVSSKCNKHVGCLKLNCTESAVEITVEVQNYDWAYAIRGLCSRSPLVWTDQIETFLSTEVLIGLLELIVKTQYHGIGYIIIKKNV